MSGKSFAWSEQEGIEGCHTLLGGAVEFGDVEAALGLGGELLPGGREALAVSAPRGVELHEPNAL